MRYYAPVATDNCASTHRNAACEKQSMDSILARRARLDNNSLRIKEIELTCEIELAMLAEDLHTPCQKWVGEYRPRLRAQQTCRCADPHTCRGSYLLETSLHDRMVSAFRWASSESFGKARSGRRFVPAQSTTCASLNRSAEFGSSSFCAIATVTTSQISIRGACSIQVQKAKSNVKLGLRLAENLCDQEV